ncbi:pseudouridine synthase [Aquabacter spiritensis]|uniref:Pseudouridine synthase n=1 Tax=Aquabacter spiritensis TaxID=933073 RepID=A0A4R3LQU2_9HYPH|nr:pseudouridine synthase [Aquabacter spiritensis]TCT02934.1 23S rRNA pseudouridine2605 synthase [Aquabacter spiritensis]
MPQTPPPRKDKNRVPRAPRAPTPTAPAKEAERVAKVIARAGLGSRREIEDWIAAGRIAVNGVVLTSPAITVTPADAIAVDGAALPERERTRLFLYHKPKGVVTTNRDPEGRTTLFEILPSGLPRLVSIGRLDLNSEGLLLLTNDGGLARVLELPETGWLRRYRVRAKGDIDQARLDALLGGITVEGITYGPIEATLDRVQGANAWITVSLREGKNREVRNVLAALGMQVNRLIRISYGPFQLGDVPEGGIEEVRTRILRDQIGDELTAAAGADFDAPLIERDLGPPPPRPADADPRRVPGPARRTDREPEGRGRTRHPRGEQEDAVAFRLRSRRADPDREVESRGTVADRKGRQVKVERVVAPPPEEERRPPRRKSSAPDRAGGPRGKRPTPARTRPGAGFDDGDDRRPARSGPRMPREGGPREKGPREGGTRERGAWSAPAGQEDFRRGGEGRKRPEGGHGKPRRAEFGDRTPHAGAKPERSEARPYRGARSESEDGRPPRRARDEGFGARPPREERSKTYGERPARDAAKPFRAGRPTSDTARPPRRARETPDTERPARGRDDGFGARPPREERSKTYGERPARDADKPFRAGRPTSDTARPPRRARETTDSERPARGHDDGFGARDSGARRAPAERTGWSEEARGDRSPRPARSGGKPGYAGRGADKPAGGRFDGPRPPRRTEGADAGAPASRPGAKPGGRPAGKAGGRPAGKPGGKFTAGRSPGGKPTGGKSSGGKAPGGARSGGKPGGKAGGPRAR